MREGAQAFAAVAGAYLVAHQAGIGVIANSGLQ